jgi:hypothetical protein
VAHATGIGFVDPPGLKMRNFKTNASICGNSLCFRPGDLQSYAGAFERDVTLELPVFLLFNLDRFWRMPNRGALDSRSEKT